MLTVANLDGLCIPLPATWYGNANSVCTPNGGFAYLSVSAQRAMYIPPHSVGNTTSAICFYANSALKAIACDPDWSGSQKQLVTMDAENMMCAWDVDTQLVAQSCSAHVSKTSGKSGSRNRRGSRSSVPRREKSNGTLCSLSATRCILSNVDNVFVQWCLTSNTYTTFGIDAMFERDHIAEMSASPFDGNLVAMATDRALICIVDIARKQILHRLRGHDKPISSLEWMRLPTFVDGEANEVDQAATNKHVERPKIRAVSASPASRLAANEEKRLRGNLVPIVDADDVFDIYDYDDRADEFGVVNRSTYVTSEHERKRLQMSAEENTASNDSFDFASACQSLKDDINCVQDKSRQDDSAKQPKPTEDDIAADLENLKLSAEKVNDAVELSNDSAVASHVDDASAANGAPTKVSDVVYLVSGSSESLVWIWNVSRGIAVQKVEMKRPPKNPGIPDPRTFLCWFEEQRTLIASTPNGEIVAYDVLPDKNNKLAVKQRFDEYSINHVTGVYKYPGYAQIWTKTINNEIQCTSVSKEPQILRHFCAAVIPQMTMRQSPHDPTLIAMAGTGRRINVFHLSSLSWDCVKLTPYTARVQGKVLCVTWHPERENQLAFCTEEGRVGIYDMSNPSNTPNIVQPFTSSSIYRMAWAKVDMDGANASLASLWVLLVISQKRLFCIPDCTSNKFEVVQMNTEFDVMSVGVSSEYIALGTTNGSVAMYRPTIRTKIFPDNVWFSKLPKTSRYISECAFSPVNKNLLAVASSDSGIHVFDIGVSDENSSGVTLQPRLLNELVGHDGVTMVNWSTDMPDRIVSSGFDGTVRVWNVESGHCEALTQFNSVMCSAMFLPSDENFVLTIGVGEMVRIFDARRHANGKMVKNAVKRMKPFRSQTHQYANCLGTSDITRSNELPVEKMRVNAEHDPTADENSKAKEKGSPKMLAHPSICAQSHREFNTKILDLLNGIITNSATSSMLNRQLFGSRQDVRNVLKLELEALGKNRGHTNANYIIPQLCDEIESEIMLCIKQNRLTERHLAMAPFVSYKFWTTCCEAYFKQMLVLGSPLQALPYLLALRKIDEAINFLCESNFFHEALIVAKLHREANDDVFEKITDKWVAYLKSTGHLEGAAYVSICADRHLKALELLEMRRNPSMELKDFIETLKRFMKSYVQKNGH